MKQKGNLTNAEREKLYYKPTKILSYKKTLNLIVGLRGRGKTYNIKKKFISEAIADKTGNSRFAWFKTTHKQNKDMNKKDGFLKDIRAAFPFNELSRKGQNYYADGKLIGYQMELSAHEDYKSNSYADIINYCLDEFCQKKRTQFDQSFAFWDSIETIFRDRENVNVFCLSNTLTVDNWLFKDLKIELKPGTVQGYFPGKEYILELDDSDIFVEHKKRSPVGRLTKDLEYGKYSMENSFIFDDSSFVEKYKGIKKYMFSVVVEKKTYGLWALPGKKFYLCDDKTPEGDKFYFDKESMQPGLINGAKTEVPMFLWSLYMEEVLTFQNQTVKNAAIRIYEIYHGKFGPGA